MDITVYDKLYEAVERAITTFNATSAYKVALAHYAPNEPKYPLVILTENRNQPLTRYYGSRERISSLGYTVEIYAKTYKGKTKQQVAREIMQFVVDFMQNEIKIRLISNNEFDSTDQKREIYRIVLVFQRPFYENKETFI